MWCELVNRYSNPDMPDGHVGKKSYIDFEEGCEADGVYYEFLDLILELKKLEAASSVSKKKHELTPTVSSSEDSKSKDFVKKPKRKSHRSPSPLPSTSTSLSGENIKRQKIKAHRSPSPSPSTSTSLSRESKSIKQEYHYEDDKRRIKLEMEEPLHLHGYYFCEICNLQLNSLTTYNTHINGKRHLKQMKLRDVSEVVLKTIPSAPTQHNSKYPKIPSGVTRLKLQNRANIQTLIEKNIHVPCPGLDMVVEIQGIIETTYYCALCDSVCSPNSIVPHLTGQKHRMKLVKHYDPDYYKVVCDTPKRYEKKIFEMLYSVQRKEGLGKIAVEKEELLSASDRGYNMDQPSTSREKIKSFQEQNVSFIEHYNRHTVPDTSKSDYYCNICDSHMNSLQMWDQHLAGKRHMTNLKKMPGELPSKTKTIPTNSPAVLMETLEDVDEPIVGLNFIREIQIHETGSQTYHCFLCSSCLTTIDIIDHLISSKHRHKYLDSIDFQGREVLRNLSSGASNTLTVQMCEEVEAKEGRGTPEVHTTKSAVFNL